MEARMWASAWRLSGQSSPFVDARDVEGVVARERSQLVTLFKLTEADRARVLVTVRRVPPLLSAHILHSSCIVIASTIASMVSSSCSMLAVWFCTVDILFSRVCNCWSVAAFAASAAVF